MNSYAISIIGAVCASSVALATPPANDMCGNPTVINGYELHDSVNTSAASIQVCEAISDCNEDFESHSVWYRITAPQSGILEVGAYTDYSCLVAVFNGCALSTQIGCFQPQCLDCNKGWADRANFAYAYIYGITVEEGDTCLIKLASISGTGGNASIDICLHPFLVHDEPETAKVIDGIEFNEFVDTIGAHMDACEANDYSPCADGERDNTVWYRYTAPVDGIAVAHTVGSEYDTILSAYDDIPVEGPGGTCNNVDEFDCSDDAGSYEAMLLVPMQAGQTRWFRVDADWVDGWFDEPFIALSYHLAFNFAFLPTGAPPNDACATATVITTTPFNPPVLPIDTANASSSEPNENCETLGFGVSNSVFYKFTAPSDGTVGINTFGSDYDTVLSVFSGCGIVTLNGYVQPMLLACNNDVGGILSPLSALTLDVESGDTIVIKVSDNGLTPGSGLLDFNLTFTQTLPCPADVNDDGIVNGADLSVLLGGWGGSGVGDINNDGVVNAADLSILLGTWGGCP